MELNNQKRHEHLAGKLHLFALGIYSSFAIMLSMTYLFVHLFNYNFYFILPLALSLIIILRSFYEMNVIYEKPMQPFVFLPLTVYAISISCLISYVVYLLVNFVNFNPSIATFSCMFALVTIQPKLMKKFVYKPRKSYES